MKKAWAAKLNKDKNDSKKGFTVVELIVVIVVIAILATITTFIYLGVQKNGRDAQRTKDATQLKLAIEQYHADNGGYPSVCSGDNVGCSVTNLATALQPYLTVPTDPSGTANNYQYVRGTAATDSYGLYIIYESKTPCKVGQNMAPAWWGAPNCTL